MRMLWLLATALALLVAVPAAHAADRAQIIADCNADGDLDGNYTPSEIRDARNNIPTDIDQYSDCRDVLSRAISAKTAASNNNNSNSGGTDNSGGTGGSTGSGGGGGTGGTDVAPNPTTAPQATATPSGRDPGIRIGPSTPEDWNAIKESGRYANEPVEVNGRPISPAASVGRNGLPGTIVVVLALLAAAAIAMTVPFVRRRVATRSSPA